MVFTLLMCLRVNRWSCIEYLLVYCMPQRAQSPGGAGDGGETLPFACKANSEWLAGRLGKLG